MHLLHRMVLILCTTPTEGVKDSEVVISISHLKTTTVNGCNRLTWEVKLIHPSLNFVPAYRQTENISFLPARRQIRKLQKDAVLMKNSKNFTINLKMVTQIFTE